MDLSALQNFSKDAWYRGHKRIKVLSGTDKVLHFSNSDVVQVKDDGLYINKQLVSNIPDMTAEEVIILYTNYLKTKGYKFLNM
jgi:hypothetical protein